MQMYVKKLYNPGCVLMSFLWKTLKSRIFQNLEFTNNGSEEGKFESTARRTHEPYKAEYQWFQANLFGLQKLKTSSL